MIPIRVAFPFVPSANWTGGYNYLLNLFNSLREYQANQITPILFCGEDAPENDLQPYYEITGVEVVHSSVFNAKKKSSRLLRAIVFGLDSDALDLFRQYKIDVVFENAKFFGWRFPIPVIAWIPDFQHRRLREQFGFRAYWRRELGFRAQIAFGRLIMLSSEDARKDCELFYPGAIGNTVVVRFSAPIPEELIVKSPETVLDGYQLPKKFFYLPNQFWKHKNHMLVIKALALLKKQGHEMVVAVTGNPRDPRHPEYFEQLKNEIESQGLQNNFRILGLVPRLHVVSLMRVCTALLNPSYFEGWSTTVEEARMLGVPMLLSNIGVHQEQMGKDAIYFDPDNANSLAVKLKEAFDTLSSVKDRRPDSRAEKYIKRFAGDFASAIKRTVTFY
jgi:glycosyltransferase involved in cell wall biosynthesis